MKEFRKNEQGMFVCEECALAYKNMHQLNLHIHRVHGNKQEYFDKWLKEEDDGKCKICKNPTNFYSLYGYKNCCSKKCSNIYAHEQSKKGILKIYGVENNFQRKDCKEKAKQTCLKNHGVEYSMQSPEIREKGKQTKKERYDDEYYTNREKSSETCFKHYGVRNPLQSEEIREKEKQTKLERYGDENYRNKEKQKQTKKERYDDEYYNNKEKTVQTNLEKRGVKCSFQSEETKDKCKQTKLERYDNEHYTNREKSKETCFKNNGVRIPFESFEIRKKSKQTKKERYDNENYRNDDKIKETCLKRFGVENPQQNIEVHKKTQKSGFAAKNFRDTDLYYRGTFEEDFLDKHHYLHLEIINASSIKYMFEDKKHYYFPDFYIKSLNLIIEIKSSYYYKKYKDKCDAKANATITAGFNYIMIIDKDYTEFNKLIK